MYGELMMVALVWNLATTEQLLTTPGVVLMNPVEARIVEKTNAERRRHGLHPLEVDGQLVRSAR